MPINYLIVSSVVIASLAFVINRHWITTLYVSLLLSFVVLASPTIIFYILFIFISIVVVYVATRTEGRRIWSVYIVLLLPIAFLLPDGVFLLSFVTLSVLAVCFATKIDRRLIIVGHIVFLLPFCSALMLQIRQELILNGGANELVEICFQEVKDLRDSISSDSAIVGRNEQLDIDVVLREPEAIAWQPDRCDTIHAEPLNGAMLITAKPRGHFNDFCTITIRVEFGDGPASPITHNGCIIMRLF